jgi:hypothetical protein
VLPSGLKNRGDRLRALLAVVATFCVIAVAAPAQGHQAALRAEFVYRLATLTTWPASAFGPSGVAACIAVIGDEPMARALQKTVEGKRLHGREIAVKHLEERDVRHGCQVVFLGESQAEHLSEAVEVVSARPVLTISDADSFVDQGGMIQLVSVKNRLRFSINRRAALRSELKISSKILRLATRVIDDAR